MSGVYSCVVHKCGIVWGTAHCFGIVLVWYAFLSYLSMPPPPIWRYTSTQAPARLPHAHFSLSSLARVCFCPSSGTTAATACTGNTPAPTVLTATAEPSDVPTVSGNSIFVLAKGATSTSSPLMLMYNADTYVMYNNATLVQSAAGSGITPQKLTAYGTSVIVIPMDQVRPPPLLV